MKNQNVKILVNSMSNGGAEKVAAEIANFYKFNSVDTEFVTLDDRDNVPINICANCINLVNYSPRFYRSFFSFFVQAYKLSKICDESTIVQSHLLRSHYVNVFARIFFKSKHKVHLVHHSNYDRFYGFKFNSLINLFLIRYLLRFSDKNIFVSKYCLRCQNRIMPLNDSCVIYNPITTYMDKINSSFDIFKKDSKYLIIVGRLVKIKRLSDAIKALYFLDSDIYLIILGDGPEKNKLVNLVRILNLSDRVIFLGWVDNPLFYIEHSDILLSCSESESFGNTIIEAFASNTPVISSRSGGPIELLQDGRGLLYSTGMVFSLVVCIEKILSDKELEDNLKKKSFYFYESVFKNDRCLKKYLEIILS